MENKEITKVVEQLPRSRQKMIEYICSFSLLFIALPIAGGSYESFPWAIAFVCAIIIVKLSFWYQKLFKWLFMPKHIQTEEPTEKEKFFYFTMMGVCPYITLITDRLLPFGNFYDGIIALATNFILAMVLCYKIAVKRS